MKTPGWRILDEEDHPVVGDLLRSLRDVELQRDRARFREALGRLGEILAYEAARGLPVRQAEVATPLGRRCEPVLVRQPVLGLVLRAGIPLAQGALRMLPRSDTLIMGAARREGRMQDGDRPFLEVDLAYAALTPLPGRTLIYCDPMIATGSTLRRIHAEVCRRAGHPERVVVAAAVVYRGVLDELARDLGAHILAASADEELDERGYIVPGLGDAGDLALGDKL